MLIPEKSNCPLLLVVILYHTSFLLSVDCYSFPASSDSPQLLPSEQPSALAVTDSVQGPEVLHPGTRTPRRSSRRPFSTQPNGRKGLHEDTRGADAVAAGPRRASVKRQELPGGAPAIGSADIAGSGQERSQDR